MYCKKNFIVIYEKIKDKKIAAKFKIEKLKLLELIRLLIPKRLTAARMGIESKKDIFAESYLSNCKNRAAVIPIPDLLTPGIKDAI